MTVRFDVSAHSSIDKDINHGSLYNHQRPHSALGNITPAEFAIKSTLEKQAA